MIGSMISTFRGIVLGTSRQKMCTQNRMASEHKNRSRKVMMVAQPHKHKFDGGQKLNVVRHSHHCTELMSGMAANCTVEEARVQIPVYCSRTGPLQQVHTQDRLDVTLQVVSREGSPSAVVEDLFLPGKGKLSVENGELLMDPFTSTIHPQVTCTVKAAVPVDAAKYGVQTLTMTMTIMNGRVVEGWEESGLYIVALEEAHYLDEQCKVLGEMFALPSSAHGALETPWCPPSMKKTRVVEEEEDGVTVSARPQVTVGAVASALLGSMAGFGAVSGLYIFYRRQDLSTSS